MQENFDVLDEKGKYTGNDEGGCGGKTSYPGY